VTSNPSAHADVSGGLAAVDDGYDFPVRAGGEMAGVARKIARRVDGGRRYLADLLGFRPALSLRVLGPADWDEHAEHPVYGMPHLTGDTLVVPGGRSPFWDGFVTMIAVDDPTSAGQVAAVYPGRDGRVDLTPFVHLLAVHEVAHLFQPADRVRFPRRWLTELACDLALHAYVADVEPAALPVLETFPRALAGVDLGRFPAHQLADFEASAPDMESGNYAWYQAQLHLAAKRVVEAEGSAAIPRLWRAFPPDRDEPDDSALLEVLAAEASPTLAGLIREWPVGY
jgi:hypothetical protein